MDQHAARFLTRLIRFDPGALVRLRPAGEGRVALWGALPWGVLVTRTVDGFSASDRTVAATDLLAGAVDPARRDAEWRWALPPAAAGSVEVLPASVVRDVARAAAQTLKTAMESGVDGQPVGSRRLRDALLDHVAVTVTVDRPGSPLDGRVVEIPVRVVQGVTRMGLLAPDDAAPAPRDVDTTTASVRAPQGVPVSSATPPQPAGVAADQVEVLVAGAWTGLAGPAGTVWYRPAGPSLRPV
ncbi:MAG: hypothetical protein HOV79_13275 [Hamadaea sp.]|nr:hypothetical protein [Hamadaea sp.]